MGYGTKRTTSNKGYKGSAKLGSPGQPRAKGMGKTETCKGKKGK